jgi:hypothetical protein
MSTAPTSSQFVLRYESLSRSGRALSFPCDAQGSVRIDDLGRREMTDYLFARAVVGVEYAAPQVQCVAPH